MLLAAAETHGSCPVCTCPNNEQSRNFQPPNFDEENLEPHTAIHSKRSSDVLESIQQPSSPIHMGPNEIAASAETFSRQFFKVSIQILTV